MIVCFKVLNGDEIIGEYISETDNIVVIKNPIMLVLQNTGNGVSAGFVPILSTCSPMAKEIPFYKHSLLISPVEVNAEIEKHYLSTTSGLIL